ncbi:MAG: hypothetical protein HZA78_09920 [Candidatus Schekmanbacteria bacterium]|nr:hypothetical protein [Candidatus Schekmanbacteria bacterium]
MSAKIVDYVSFRVEKSKLEKAKKYFHVKSDEAVIERVFSWFEYAKDVNEAMEGVGGKGKIRKVYEG